VSRIRSTTSSSAPAGFERKGAHLSAQARGDLRPHSEKMRWTRPGDVERSVYWNRRVTGGVSRAAESGRPSQDEGQ
jgi:hypothetical protein